MEKVFSRWESHSDPRPLPQTSCGVFGRHWDLLSGGPLGSVEPKQIGLQSGGFSLSEVLAIRGQRGRGSHVKAPGTAGGPLWIGEAPAALESD